MKKIVFHLVFVAITTVSGVYFDQSEDSRRLLSATTLANIEALSRTESGYKYVTPIQYSWGWGCNCAGNGSEECCG